MSFVEWSIIYTVSLSWEVHYQIFNCITLILYTVLNYLCSHTPPGTSDEHLTVVKALMNARPEGAIIVTTPQEMALTTIRKEINFCRKMNLKILGIVENMSGYMCPCCQVCIYILSHNLDNLLLLWVHTEVALWTTVV